MKRPILTPWVAAMIGKQFGLLTVASYVGHKKYEPIVRCYCDCGSIVLRRAYLIKTGGTKSCGCYRRWHSGILNKKHGFSRSKGPQQSVYTIWKSMHRRCETQSVNGYADYGGRGIVVCGRWSGSNGFVHFLSDMGQPPLGGSIERKDNNKGYCKSNCIWIPKKNQAKNRRYNWRVRLNGEVLNAREATLKLGLGKDTVA
ncbi:MAG: hypothetical protein L0312_02030, partial [Acidobacteria bacterium]|nr:hypothetical protein [Acidobacteriota bacterium]